MISTNAISVGDTAGILVASHMTCDGLDNQSDRAKPQGAQPFLRSGYSSPTGGGSGRRGYVS